MIITEGFGTQDVKATCKTCANNFKGFKDNHSVACANCRYNKHTAMPENYKEKDESSTNQQV